MYIGNAIRADATKILSRRELATVLDGLHRLGFIPARPRYPAAIPAAPLTPAPRRFAIKPPRLLAFGVVGVLAIAGRAGNAARRFLISGLQRRE